MSVAGGFARGRVHGRERQREVESGEEGEKEHGPFLTTILN
jgi:hypothetical protein